MTVKEKVIARMVKGGFNAQVAAEKVEKYLDMAIRCYGLKETEIKAIAETVAGLAA